LKDTAEILKHEEIEIILKTSDMYINFSEMTLEEQSSWVKLVREDLEEAADDIDLFYRKIERFNKNKRTIPESVRKMLNDIRKSESFLLGETHKKLIKELVDFEHATRHLSYYNNYRTRDITRFGDGIRCSCIIARKGDNIVRYLEFLKDPIVTINGPNASNLKSTLEKKF